MLHDFKIGLRGREAWLHVTLAGNAQPFAAVKDFATLIFQSLNRMLDEIDSVLVDQRPHHRFFIEWIPYLQTLVSRQKFVPNFRRNRFVHNHASCGSATLPGCPHGTEEDL